MEMGLLQRWARVWFEAGGIVLEISMMGIKIMSYIFPFFRNLFANFIISSAHFETFIGVSPP